MTGAITLHGRDKGGTNMNGKILIIGTIEIKTGMHIGTGGDFAAIGAADSPVTRDALSNVPYIPGTSLKGKLRKVLSEKYGRGESPEKDAPEIIRLFGTSAKNKAKAARLMFSDAVLCNKDELDNKGVVPTEIKFENTINRITGVANPRQIERVIRGAKFPLELIYTIDTESDEKEIIEDFKIIADGLKLLEYDYLGGHGTRGYGRVHFADVKAECVVGDSDIDDQINEILGSVGL